MVKRYTWDDVYDGAIDVEFVLASDYAALEARCLQAEANESLIGGEIDRLDKRIAELEAALKGACGHLVRFILEGDSRQERSVDEFLVKWTEFSGVTSNAFTSETGVGK